MSHAFLLQEACLNVVVYNSLHVYFVLNNKQSKLYVDISFAIW